MRNGVSVSKKLKNPKEIPKSKNSSGGRQHAVAAKAESSAVSKLRISFFIA